jgi:long-chain acyl-CoA synthetase
VGIEPNAGRTVARLARQAEIGLAEVDLSLPQYRLLMFIDRQSAGASMLADQLAVSRPSITAVVDGLVVRGLVERKASACDRRRVELSLTDLGRELLDRADAVLDDRLAALVGELDERRRAAAGKGLALWSAALDAHRASKLAATGERR